jgi:hypothetical protein
MIEGLPSASKANNVEEWNEHIDIKKTIKFSKAYLK